MKERVLMWQERQMGVCGGGVRTSPLLQQRGGERWEVWHAGTCNHLGWKGPLVNLCPPPNPEKGPVA